MTPFAERPTLHLHIATWLEQHAPLHFSELIAEHFEKGGAGDAAYAYYLTAAAEADADEDVVRADRLFHRLLGLDVPAALRGEGLLAYAQAALLRGDKALALAQLDDADAVFDRCEQDSCAQLRDTGRRLRAEANALPDGISTAPSGIAAGGAESLAPSR